MSDRTDKTKIGDRMKAYEAPSTSRRAFKGQPIIVRLDGNNFHTFTKGLKRPYDEDLSDLMVETMKALVERFHCDIAYTQSDEITLIFTSTPEDRAELIFDGRFQKIETLTAAYATAVFNTKLAHYLPQKVHLLPCFDARAYVVPNLQEAYHVLLWRQQDATKNAISMGAQALYSQKELNGKNGPQLRQLMLDKGVDFDLYPYFFKRGTFARRVLVERPLTEEELAKIPEGRRPKGAVSRSEIATFDLSLGSDMEPLELLFGDKKQRPIEFMYKSTDVRIVKIDGMYEYRILGPFKHNDPTSWNDYQSAVEAAQLYIDWRLDNA